MKTTLLTGLACLNLLTAAVAQQKRAGATLADATPTETTIGAYRIIKNPGG